MKNEWFTVENRDFVKRFVRLPCQLTIPREHAPNVKGGTKQAAGKKQVVGVARAELTCLTGVCCDRPTHICGYQSPCLATEILFKIKYNK
jgi:hypothetical protein